MGGSWLCKAILGLTLNFAAAAFVRAESPAPRPPVGGIGSPADAMIFYVAHGASGACGPGCSDWIAAEGTVQWDTFKRLLAILDRQAGRKLPIVVHSRGESSINVAIGLGKIIRDRGLDVTADHTEVDACSGKPDADCFALKRPGGPLDARLTSRDVRCDLACAVILAGGIHRILPFGTRMILSGTVIRNRLAPNVSEERREGLTVLYGQQLRTYLRDMGIAPELADLVEKASEQERAFELPPADWIRLHLVTGPSP